MMNKIKQNIGSMIVIFLSIILIILWVLSLKSDSLNSFQTVFNSLGELFGLMGTFLFSLNIILSSRLPILENLFNGLNNVYKKHSLLGQIAFVLLLFHPLLLFSRYASNFNEAAIFLFFSNNWARNWGLISLSIMIVLIFLTLYLRPKYNIWKITHNFFGVALFLGALHAYLIPSYVMNNAPLKIFILGFVLLGIMFFLYRSVFGKWLIKRSYCTVKSVNLLNSEIAEISLSFLNNKILFEPGQFIFISFKQKGFSSESHPFSISSAPNENHLKITVKNSGDFTQNLIKNLQKGSVAEIEGPFGVFSNKKVQNKNQIWIAGGIGITPFISMAKDLLKTDGGFSVHLFYCVQNEKEAVYLNLLQDIEAKLKNKFKLIPYYSNERGYITFEQIKSIVSDIFDKAILICAPPRMVYSLKKELTKNMIKVRNIYSEEFDF